LNALVSCSSFLARILDNENADTLGSPNAVGIEIVEVDSCNSSLLIVGFSTRVIGFSIELSAGMERISGDATAISSILL
jgi:hypothetical protein